MITAKQVWQQREMGLTLRHPDHLGSFGHNLVHTHDQYCDARCGIHRASCQEDLPVAVCPRCWAEVRNGRIPRGTP